MEKIYWPKVLSLHEMFAFASRDVEKKERVNAERERRRRNRKPLKM